MKIFFIFVLLTLTLQADNVRWYSNYDKAHQKALKEKKILMVLLVEKECFLCNEILRTTFQNQPYVKEINKLFVPVLIMKGRKQSYPIEMLYTMTYPAVFFLNSEELFVGENIFGYIDSRAFQKHLNLYFK